MSVVVTSSMVVLGCRSDYVYTYMYNIIIYHTAYSHAPSIRKHAFFFIAVRSSNFVLFGEREVASGGLIWTWRKMFDRSLFHTEGIWLHSRLFVGQAAQFIISVFLIGFFFAVSSFRLLLALLLALLA